MAQELIDKIRAAAQARGIDPELALSIARAESAFDPRAKARTSSASGLFQVTKDTWKEFGGKPGRQLDPDENIRVGLDIIAKNTNTLRNALGREPRPAEVYAAHYFGPSGAKSFLSADPETPIASILGERAVKANPNLKGKTAGQVLAQLEGKVGSPASASAPAVSRETPPSPTRTPAEEIVEPALRSGMTAQAPAAQKLAALGPGYQAALALSFLSDEDEKEGRDPDTGPSVAEEWLKQTQSRPAALALSDISVRSPFEALGPQPGQPVQMNKGGDPKLEKFRNLGMRSEKEGPSLEGLREALRQVPTYGPGMGLDAGYRAYKHLTGTEPLEDFLRRVRMANEGIDPTGGMEPIERAKGGEVEEPSLFAVPDYAETVAYEMYPGQKGQFTQQDAARHMLAAGTLARKYGPTAAEMLGRLHEIKTSPFRWIGSKLGVSEMPVDYEQDLHNNQLGIEAGMRSKSQKELEDLIQSMAEQAREQKVEGKPWVGRPQRPVKRAEGGEAEPTAEELAAASRPATVNPMIRRQGEAARRLAAMRDVNTLPDPRTYAAVSGFFGVAPDEQGFSALHPDISGIKKAGQVGFGVGTAAQIAPVVSGAMKLANLGPSAAGKTTAASQLGAIKTRGGHFAMEGQTYGGPQDFSKPVDSVTNYVNTYLANTNDHPLNEWMRGKVGAYIRRDMGTEMDQFVKAADEGKKLHFINKPITEGYTGPYMPGGLRQARKTEGFPEEGVAKTPYGQNVEMITDRAVSPVALEDVYPGSVPPGLRQFVETDPSMRMYELNATQLEELKLQTLRDKMAKMRQLPESLSFYNQPGVKVPERYMLTDQALQGLTPAQASERVAQFDAWKQDVQQKMASRAAFKDPNISRTPAENGSVWLNPPDLKRNPALRELIQDVGCDGGWCTKSENTALTYGSGNNRLTVLMDSKARPQAQMTISQTSVHPDDMWAAMDDAERAAFREAHPDVALYDANAMAATPEYQQFAKMNPPGVSITEIKGVNNAVDLTYAPYLKQIQARIKDLDSRFGLQKVDNLEGINMLELRSKVPDEATRQKMIERNGGSSFMDVDEYKSMVKSLRQEDLDAAKRASGGMIERRIDSAQRYL